MVYAGWESCQCTCAKFYFPIDTSARGLFPLYLRPWKTFIGQEKPQIFQQLLQISLTWWNSFSLLLCPTGLLKSILKDELQKHKYSFIPKQDLKRLFGPWPSKTDLVGTFHYTPQNHLVGFLMLSFNSSYKGKKRKRLLPLPENSCKHRHLAWA